MRALFSALPLLSLALSAPVLAQEDDGAAWWAHVKILADDAMEGRGTGTPGYDRAADYVIGQFKALIGSGKDEQSKLAQREFMAQVSKIAKSEKVEEGGKSVTYVVLKAETIDKYGLKPRE